MNRKRILSLAVPSLVAALALYLALPAVSQAQRQPPHVFVGTALIDGAAAPQGTTVSAWVGGVEAGSGTTTGTGGDYVLVLSPHIFD